jgi:multicomponent Na+:H+ antiporter subunit B
MLAFGRDFAEKNLSLAAASKLDCVGAFAFAMIAILGSVLGGSFFVNFLYQKYLPGHPLDLISAGTIPLSNMAIGLKVGASLFLIILLLSVFRAEIPENKKE